jgi:hypothetical protein
MMQMHDLVKLAVNAHGGLEQWNNVREVTANFAASGAAFKQRGPIGEAFTQKPMRVSVNAREQNVTFEPFLESGKRGTYEPLRTALESSEGRLLEELNNPRESLKNMPAGTPWSGPQVIYFVGYSLWMYITLPFSFLMNGLICEEVEPWIETGEKWRALKVTYPESYPSHSTEQIHYFDDKGLMRRQDYTVDVRQDLRTAHYMYDHQTFDGFVFPTRRRICLRGPNGAPLWDKPLISADLSDFKVLRAVS